MLPREAVRRGFTLVELLVVISIIGVLMSLLLPAVNAARESGRKAQCLNNLKQMGLGAQQHLEKTRRYPTGGWGPRWVGFADGGTGTKQPGGWVFNLLPYMERQSLYDGTRGLKGKAQHDAQDKQMTTVLAYINCPSRRGVQGYPTNPGADPSPTSSLNYSSYCPDMTRTEPGQIPMSNLVTHSDYAANSGVRYDSPSDAIGNELGCYIDPAGAGKDGGSEYPSFNSVGASGLAFNSKHRWTGVVYQLSMVGDAGVKDGTSYTYFCGEKFIDRRHYEDGLYPGDQGNAFSGMGSDNYRGTYVKWTDSASSPNVSPGAATDPSRPAMLNDCVDPNDLSPGSKWNYQCLFGSPHSGIVNFAFCDGSTRSTSVNIDPLTHRYLGERNDNQILDDSVVNP